MPTKFFKVPGIVILFICFASCQQKNQERPSPADVQKDSIRAGSTLPPFISVEGTLEIPSADLVLITSQSAGLLKAVSVRPGRFVKSRDTLAIIENIEFLKLQQQYLEAKSDFFYYGEDLKRQGGLAIENATSVKKMQLAQRDYQTSEIRFRSLQKQLELIGFQTDSLDADHLSSEIPLLAPTSGYIDKIASHEGSQITAGETIFILVKKYAPVIVFELPEKLYPGLKTGNQIEFFFPRDSLSLFNARLSFINRQTDPSSHLIRVWAVPLKSPSRLVPGMQVSIRLPQ
jgi:membrane fusion protein, heavy metal efflux system